MTVVLDFPDPKTECDENGIVGFSNTLNTPTLLEAYRKGIFPWPMPRCPLPWFCPDPRGILRFDQFHISTSLAKFRKKNPYRITFNQNFSQVISRCAAVPRKEKGTWITADLKKAYIQLHKDGHAHSVEVWSDEDLVGGLYGVEVEGCFSAESMFHLKDHASKIALIALVERLQSQGLRWMDIQMVTPHLSTFGAEEISREDYLTLLKQTQANGLRFF